MSPASARGARAGAVVAAAAFVLAAAPGPAEVLVEVPVTSQDVRVQPSNNSPAIAVDPTNDRFVVVASRLDNPDFGCRLHVSGDGGRSWVPADPVPELPPGARTCYAPEIVFDSDGTLYYLFLGLQGRGNQPTGAFLTASDDRAQTFSRPRRILGPLNYMVRLAIDRDRDRLHLVWLRATSDPPLGGLPEPPNPILAAHSDDGGRTWSEPVEVGDPERRLVVAPAVAVGPDGAVHVVYYDLGEDEIDYRGLEGDTWRGLWAVIASTSTDGGETFSDGSVVDGGVVPPERVMVIFTMPPPAIAAGPDGTVHVAWHDARNGDWDVFARRSRGDAWGPPVRVNDDPRSGGAHQYMPRLAAAPSGRVDAIFYDRRNDPDNVRNDLYLTSSSDGGRSYGGNVRVTEEPSDARAGTTYAIPSAQGLIEFGSRLGLHSADDRTLAAWTDTHNNPDAIQQDVYATEIRWDAQSSGSAGPAVVAAVAAAVVAASAWAVVRRRRRPAA